MSHYFFSFLFLFLTYSTVTVIQLLETQSKTVLWQRLAPTCSFCTHVTKKSKFFYRNHMLGTLDFTGWQHWAPFNFYFLKYSPLEILTLCQSIFIIDFVSKQYFLVQVGPGQYFQVATISTGLKKSPVQ